MCRNCQGDFKVLPSVLSGKTNASGNFCSRPCYNRWLAQTKPEGSRGRGWKKIAKEAIRRAPFCGWCGTMRNRLDVHHIVPYRLTSDNSQDNLIPYCKVHHKMVEVATQTIEAAGDPLAMIPALAASLRFRQNATRNLLLRLARDVQSEGRDVADRSAP